MAETIVNVAFWGINGVLVVGALLSIWWRL